MFRLGGFLRLTGKFRCGASESVKAKAMEAALKAVDLDATLAEAHTTLGHVRATYCWDWPGACTEYKLATVLNPAYATVHHWYAITYLSPLELFEMRGQKLRRRNSIPYRRASKGILPLSYNGRLYEQAIEQCKKTIELEPAFQSSYRNIMRLFLHFNMR
jgi:hypothetical protein